MIPGIEGVEAIAKSLEGYIKPNSSGVNTPQGIDYGGRNIINIESQTGLSSELSNPLAQYVTIDNISSAGNQDDIFMQEKSLFPNNQIEIISNDPVDRKESLLISPMSSVFMNQ